LEPGPFEDETMRNTIPLGALAAFATLYLGGCATEEYVDNAVSKSQAQTNSQISALQGQVNSNTSQINAHSAHLAKLDSDTQAAMAKATEAERLAAGKFNDTVVTQATILFGTGRADLTGGDKSKLADLASRLKSDNKDVYLEIGGYADARGSTSLNARLGEARASAVFTYLADQGVPLNRMERVSHGELKPAASNSTAEGRAENRRVVVTVVQ
jgi:outer membrane protein OmpA-like peptidoglycan-associated protein